MIDKAILALIHEAETDVALLRRAAKAEGTVTRYEAVWWHFSQWCAARGLDPRDGDGRGLTVWLHERGWHRRPTTMRGYANAISWCCRETGPDPATAPTVRRLLNAHARFHGVAPMPENTVDALGRDDLIAIVTAPLAVRGASGVSVLRNRCVLVLGHQKVPASQILRIAPEDVTVDQDRVVVSVPKLGGRGIARTSERPAMRLVLPFEDGPLDPRQLVELAGLGPQRPLLFGVVSIDGSGRHGDAVELRPLATPHETARVIEPALRAASRRAGFSWLVRRIDHLDAVFHDELVRLWWHCNPSYLVELRTRAHAAALAATGARHSDLAHVRVDTLKRVPSGLSVFVEKSKTDPNGIGLWRLVPHTPNHPPTCPACLVSRWIAEAQLITGPLFPAMAIGGRIKATPLAVEDAAGEFQRLAARLAIERRVGTHTFRKTHATLRAEAGEEAAAIAATTGQTPDIVLRHYVRPARLLSETAQL